MAEPSRQPCAGRLAGVRQRGGYGGVGASVGDAAARLEKAGLLLLIEDGKARLEEPLPGSPFEGLGRTFDFYTDTPVEIASIALPRGRMPKEVFYLPAVLAAVLVIFMQRRRAMTTSRAHSSR